MKTFKENNQTNLTGRQIKSFVKNTATTWCQREKVTAGSLDYMKYILKDTSMIIIARNYAIEKHSLIDQKYDGEPYTKHLGMVESVALRYINYVNEADRENVLAACWCHDLIEDTGISIKQLAEATNDQIAMVVFAVSNEKATSRRERNIKTFSKILNNPLAQYVKLCDRIANTKNSKVNAPEIFNKYRWDYPLLLEILNKDGGKFQAMWDELDQLYN